MIENTRREKQSPVIEESRALERFLKFYPPQYFGKPNSKQEMETWIDQMENIFAVLNYEDMRKVKFATFKQQGPARDW
jgi:hypothetical protein